jgi:hypothetical protein
LKALGSIPVIARRSLETKDNILFYFLLLMKSENDTELILNNSIQGID